MNLRSKVDNLLRVELDKNPSLFLIKLTVGIDNSIRVILDGVKGISLKYCIYIIKIPFYKICNIPNCINNNTIKDD